VTDLFEQSDDRLRAAITDVAQDIACGTLTKKYLFGAMETLHGCSSAQGVWTQRDAYDLLEAALTQHLRDAEKPTLATIASLSRLVETLATPSWSSVRLAGRCDCSTIRMISSFSDAGYLIRRLPHPRSCFF
tara:strand:- start:340 stop:735 length:396 start_codon:yes stop_codon:yes gene_type:complete